MNPLTRSNRRRRRQAAMMLEECLVYLSIWLVLSGLAFAAYFRVLDNSTRLRRNAADITRALNAGERWRQDVRQSTHPPNLTPLAGTNLQTLRLPNATGEIVYRFDGTNVLRRAREDGPWTVTLAGVHSSRMISEWRGPVRALRWEVELRSGLKKPFVQPLFTFLAAVPGAATP